MGSEPVLWLGNTVGAAAVGYAGPEYGVAMSEGMLSPKGWSIPSTFSHCKVYPITVSGHKGATPHWWGLTVTG